MTNGDVLKWRGPMARRSLLAVGMVVIGLVASGCSTTPQQVKTEESPVEALSYPAMAAHRGGLSLYPEATMKGFAAIAEEYPQAVLEMDVRQLADGALAIFHDGKVDRIAADARGPVAKMSSEQWRSLRIKDPQGGTAEPPVLLQEVLDRFGDSPRVLMIERKGKTSLEDFLEALRPFRAQTIVQDFSAKNVRSMTAAGFDTLQLTADPEVEIVEGVHALGVSSAAIDADLCQRAHELDVRVWVWGDDVVKGDPEMLEMGVDGFMVNNPRLKPSVDSSK